MATLLSKLDKSGRDPGSPLNPFSYSVQGTAFILQQHGPRSPGEKPSAAFPAGVWGILFPKSDRDHQERRAEKCTKVTRAVLKDFVYLGRRPGGASKCDAAKKEAGNHPLHRVQIGKDAISLSCSKGNVG